MADEPNKASDLAPQNDGGRVYLLAFPASFQPSSLDLNRWIRLAAAGWIALGAGFAVGLFGGFAASYLVRNQYSAETVLMIAQEDSGKGLLGSVLSEFGAAGAAVALGVDPSDDLKVEAVAYLNSTEFAEAMIVKHGLLGDLYPNEWDHVGGKWRKLDDAPSMNDAIKKFREEHFSCIENRSAGTIAVGFVSPRRESLATVVNGMIVDVNNAMRVRAIAEAERSIQFLKDQLGVTTTVEIRQLISRLLESQYSRRMLAHSREDYAFRVVDPARIPDSRRKVFPRRSFWAAGGAFLGLCVGFIFLLRRAASKSVPLKAS